MIFNRDLENQNEATTNKDSGITTSSSLQYFKGINRRDNNSFGFSSFFSFLILYGVKRPKELRETVS